MAEYKEPHFDKAGAKALADAWGKANVGNVKKKAPGKAPAKKPQKAGK